MTDLSKEEHIQKAAPSESLRKERKPKMSTRKRNKVLFFITVFFLAVAFLYLLYYLLISRFEIFTDDAYVDGNVIQVMSQIPGTVIAVKTEDTYFVQQGDLLIELASNDQEFNLARAKAKLASTVRQVNQYYAATKRAAALLTIRKENLKKLKSDIQRRYGLIDKRAISKEELQHLQTEIKIAEAEVRQARYSKQGELAMVKNTSLYNHPLVASAKAEFANAYLALLRTKIYAPVSGYVVKKNAQVGQQVNSQLPLFAIIPASEVWVNANYKESQLNGIHIGQRVTLTSDRYEDIIFHGKVTGISAGTGSAFALLPAQNATGNWIKIVQRLPVRIKIDADEVKKYPLAIGLSMQATIHPNSTSNETNVSNQAIGYETKIYNYNLEKMNLLINQILRENASEASFPNINSVNR